MLVMDTWPDAGMPRGRRCRGEHPGRHPEPGMTTPSARRSEFALAFLRMTPPWQEVLVANEVSNFSRRWPRRGSYLALMLAGQLLPMWHYLLSARSMTSRILNCESRSSGNEVRKFNPIATGSPARV